MKALEVLFGVKAEVTHRLGNGISGRVYFKAVSESVLNNEQIRLVQSNLGYHPDGYGGPWELHLKHKWTDNPLRTLPAGYIYTWNCSASCD